MMIIVHQLRSFWRLTLLLIALITIPYLLVAHWAPAGTQFLGALINPDDLSVYLAAIRQGAEGEWLFEVTFTPEPIAPKLTYPFYLALGRLVHVSSLDPLQLFHISRIIAALILCAVVALWLNFLKAAEVKRDAFFLIFLSGGWGWLFLSAGWVLPDIHVAEWTPFLTIFYAPHFALGLAAEVLVMGALLMAGRRPSIGHGWIAATAALGAVSLALLYPYRIVPLAGVIGLYLLVEVGREWRRRPSLLITSLPSLAILGVMTLYYAIVARSDPLWEATHVVQNNIPAPHLIESFMGWGIPALLAIFGVKAALKNWSQLPDVIRLCMIWFSVGAACLYLPVSFQGRFALGIYLPLAVIAAWSLHERLLPQISHWEQSPRALKLTPTPLATVRRLILILAIPSIFAFMGMAARRAEFFPEQYFIPLAEVRAAEWLADYSDKDDLILVGSRMGNYLPRHITGRVFVGQYYVTVDPDRKVALVAQFFAPETDDEWRLSFLEEWQISHIYYGYYEAQVGPPPNLPGWAQVYADGGVLVYKAER